MSLSQHLRVGDDGSCAVYAMARTKHVVQALSDCRPIAKELVHRSWLEQQDGWIGKEQGYLRRNIVLTTCLHAVLEKPKTMDTLQELSFTYHALLLPTTTPRSRKNGTCKVQV
ncbi:hypothetical protein NDU88_000658 [Pleurodeles waltl]|uniref:Uncharacterized protein n=1 Tax=Pleurodeles waltl TaxID=8319 RepID=A0AAV7V9N9_PLEWA|nr:hypothetical protein NDU88_000658 [Pleurodeles waltl]